MLQARCRCKKVVDVGITFQERVAGESKLTMEQNIFYLRQLWSTSCLMVKASQPRRTENLMQWAGLYLYQWTLLLWMIFGLFFAAGFIGITLVLMYKFVTIAL
jgi:hypothetical protein